VQVEGPLTRRSILSAAQYVPGGRNSAFQGKGAETRTRSATVEGSKARPEAVARPGRESVVANRMVVPGIPILRDGFISGVGIVYSRAQQGRGDSGFSSAASRLRKRSAKMALPAQMPPKPPVAQAGTEFYQVVRAAQRRDEERGIMGEVADNTTYFMDNAAANATNLMDNATNLLASVMQGPWQGSGQGESHEAGAHSPKRFSVEAIQRSIARRSRGSESSSSSRRSSSRHSDTHLPSRARVGPGLDTDAPATTAQPTTEADEPVVNAVRVTAVRGRATAMQPSGASAGPGSYNPGQTGRLYRM